LIAATLLERAAHDGVEVTLQANGRLKASGPRDALARWLPELKAAKPSILNTMAVEPAAANWRGRLRELPSTQCPDALSPDRWTILLDGVERFARDWAVKTISLGWTFEDLFAFREPFANVSLQGAAWFIGSSTVTAVTAHAITLRTESGSIPRIYRKPRA
jgi:hypothetical protein